MSERSAIVSELPAGVQALLTRELDTRLAALRQELEAQIAELRERTPEDRATLVIFSGDLDKVLAGFVVATGAAAAGLSVSMFFTFWGLTALKRAGARGGPKSLKERLFALMTPSGPKDLGMSRMNYFGMGSRMLRSMMKEKQIASLEELMEVARELEVKIIACTMSMDAMGVGKQELIDGIEYGGVAYYMADAARSRVTLFI